MKRRSPHMDISLASSGESACRAPSAPPARSVSAKVESHFACIGVARLVPSLDQFSADQKVNRYVLPCLDALGKVARPGLEVIHPTLHCIAVTSQSPGP